MTRDDMMKLLHECGYDTLMDDPIMKPLALRRAENMMRFAALVAAEKEQQMIRDGWRQCAKGQRTTQYCGLLDAAVKDEREACAKVCEWEAAKLEQFPEVLAIAVCAAAIRARGEV